ncbi:hypothetical protein GBAR_LOCUS25120 [Geodia barretti]|uniref:Uncharacterized protein n=1 Tax=Geodia barretti TaxID=519541 RepID=A0AA35XAJ6_GEOBA|nr:hypothetical protein GBAR_LOCUS25120 [Geodia barretti]
MEQLLLFIFTSTDLSDQCAVLVSSNRKTSQSNLDSKLGKDLTKGACYLWSHGC